MRDAKFKSHRVLSSQHQIKKPMAGITLVEFLLSLSLTILLILIAFSLWTQLSNLTIKRATSVSISEQVSQILWQIYYESESAITPVFWQMSQQESRGSELSYQLKLSQENHTYIQHVTWRFEPPNFKVCRQNIESENLRIDQEISSAFKESCQGRYFNVFVPEEIQIESFDLSLAKQMPLLLAQLTALDKASNQRQTYSLPIHLKNQRDETGGEHAATKRFKSY